MGNLQVTFDREEGFLRFHTRKFGQMDVQPNPFMFVMFQEKKNTFEGVQLSAIKSFLKEPTPHSLALRTGTSLVRTAVTAWRPLLHRGEGLEGQPRADPRAPGDRPTDAFFRRSEAESVGRMRDDNDDKQVKWIDLVYPPSGIEQVEQPRKVELLGL